MALESERNIEFAKWLKQWRMVIHNRTPMRSQPEKREIDSTPLRGQPVGCEAGNKTTKGTIGRNSLRQDNDREPARN